MFFWTKQLEYIQKQIDELQKQNQKHHENSEHRFDKIEKVLIAQEINLKEHMKRSDHLETLVLSDRKKHQQEFAVVNKHINMVQGAFKLLGVISLIVGIIAGLFRLSGVV